MFEGFSQFSIDTGETTICGVTGGAGPPLLLLHGYPQTHAMWHRVAPLLVNDFTLVAADLRGYGDSGKPASVSDHSSYSKRAMAADMVDVMQDLGHEKFFLAGHDRGGRVAHRLAIDHGERIAGLCVLDIAPTREMYANTDDAFARAYWHWFFLIQPSPFPEGLINADSDGYLKYKMNLGFGGLNAFDQNALDEYLRCYRNPETVRASCEDYRAAAGIDIKHDDADGEFKLTCPLHVLWGEHGIINRCFDAEALWNKRAESVTVAELPCGHYLAEELPEETARHMKTFFLSLEASGLVCN